MRVGAETPTPDYFCCPASLLRQVAGYYAATNSASANMLTGTVTSGLNAFAFMNDLLQRSYW